MSERLALGSYMHEHSHGTKGAIVDARMSVQSERRYQHERGDKRYQHEIRATSAGSTHARMDVKSDTR
jgi:single-stranded DNA-binding protein